MAKTTILEGLLKQCKTMRQCFEVQNALADGLTAQQELELRAKYAGLTILEAKCYQNALSTIKAIEAKPVERQLQEVTRTICNLVAR